MTSKRPPATPEQSRAGGLAAKVKKERDRLARDIAKEIDELRRCGAVFFDELTPEEQRRRLADARVIRFKIVHPVTGFTWPPAKRRHDKEQRS